MAEPDAIHVRDLLLRCVLEKPSALRFARAVAVEMVRERPDRT
jgi:hypothetical protein